MFNSHQGVQWKVLQRCKKIFCGSSICLLKVWFCILFSTWRNSGVLCLPFPSTLYLASFTVLSLLCYSVRWSERPVEEQKQQRENPCHKSWGKLKSLLAGIVLHRLIWWASLQSQIPIITGTLWRYSPQPFPYLAFSLLCWVLCAIFMAAWTWLLRGKSCLTSKYPVQIPLCYWRSSWIGKRERQINWIRSL